MTALIARIERELRLAREDSARHQAILANWQWKIAMASVLAHPEQFTKNEQDSARFVITDMQRRGHW